MNFIIEGLVERELNAHFLIILYQMQPKEYVSSIFQGLALRVRTAHILTILRDTHVSFIIYNKIVGILKIVVFPMGKSNRALSLNF